MPKASIIRSESSLKPRPDLLPGERILIVDDDVDFADSIGDMLGMRGYACATTHSVADFPGAVARFAPQVCLIDNRLGTESGITLLESIAASYPDIIPIMMTGFAGTDAAIEALRHHAYDYLRKPIEAEDLFASLSRAFEKQKLIRQRKSTELALRTSEEKFSKAFVSNPVPIAIVSLKDQKLLDVNDAFETFSGYCRAEANGKSLRDLGLWTKPNDEESLMQGLRALGSVRDHELFIKTRAGNVRDCVASAEAVTIGHEACTIVAIEDLTREREAKQALEKSEQRFRSLYDTMPAMFLTIGPDGCIKSVNSYGARMLGYDITAIVGSSLYKYVVADNKDQQEAFISRCF